MKQRWTFSIALIVDITLKFETSKVYSKIIELSNEFKELPGGGRATEGWGIVTLLRFSRDLDNGILPDLLLDPGLPENELVINLVGILISMKVEKE